MSIFNHFHKNVLAAITAVSLISFSGLLGHDKKIEQLKEEGRERLQEVHERLENYRKDLIRELNELKAECKSCEKKEKTMEEGKKRVCNMHLCCKKMEVKCMEKEINGLLAHIYKVKLNMGCDEKEKHHRK